MTATVGPWRLLETRWRPKRGADQGLATVVQADGDRTLVFRGSSSVAPDLRADGWDHIGDPDWWGGAIFDAYQRTDASAASKLFRVTTADGETHDFEHRLVRDAPVAELFNNSFAAVSPDGMWLVSGEWGQVDRLLVFPTPTINPGAPPPGADLPLAGLLRLDHPVRNFQGAVFAGDTTLLCSTDDAGGGPTPLWPVPRQLLRVTLARPLPDTSQPATVECLGALPCPTFGLGQPEVEGIDLDRQTGDLRVIIVPRLPFSLLVAGVYRFRRGPGVAGGA